MPRVQKHSEFLHHGLENLSKLAEGAGTAPWHQQTILQWTMVPVSFAGFNFQHAHAEGYVVVGIRCSGFMLSIQMHQEY